MKHKFAVGFAVVFGIGGAVATYLTFLSSGDSAWIGTAIGLVIGVLALLTGSVAMFLERWNKDLRRYFFGLGCLLAALPKTGAALVDSKLVAIASSPPFTWTLVVIGGLMFLGSFVAWVHFGYIGIKEDSDGHEVAGGLRPGPKLKWPWRQITSFQFMGEMRRGTLYET